MARQREVYKCFKRGTIFELPHVGGGSLLLRRADETDKEKSMKKYACSLCGYEYDPAEGDPDNGVPAGTPWEKVPTDWVCPVCGAGKESFEPA